MKLGNYFLTSIVVVVVVIVIYSGGSTNSKVAQGKEPNEFGLTVRNQRFRMSRILEFGKYIIDL